ncbi:hypothetical protein [Serratia marcescens]|uniref:hypothetical protein n=1 Tax=Serratia marcescens TaxID=615 RepID=UPI00195323FE|nr:hypothetical protein [Serratia marcescens]
MDNLSKPVAWTDAEELRDLEKDGCGAMLSLEKCKGGDPRRQILLFTHPAPETELKAVVERLNASGYEYENGPVTTRNASAVVDILLQQLDDAVQERGTQSEPAVPEEMPKHLAGQIVSLLSHNIGDKLLAQKIWNACRAAMLEPVSLGYKLVPVEPTAKQWAAGVKAMDSGIDKVTLVYKAMLETAPTQGKNNE